MHIVKSERTRLPPRSSFPHRYKLQCLSWVINSLNQPPPILSTFFDPISPCPLRSSQHAPRASSHHPSRSKRVHTASHIRHNVPRRALALVCAHNPLHIERHLRRRAWLRGHRCSMNGVWRAWWCCLRSLRPQALRRHGCCSSLATEVRLLSC